MAHLRLEGLKHMRVSPFHRLVASELRSLEVSVDIGATLVFLLVLDINLS